MSHSANTTLGSNNTNCMTFNAAGNLNVTLDYRAQIPAQKSWFKTQPRNPRDLLSLLRWDSRISDRIGRDVEFDDLLEWTDGGGPGIQARLISGNGGAGKSRLAGDLAQELVKRGWRAEKLSDKLTEQLLLPLGDFQPQEPKTTLADQLPQRQPINKPTYKGGLLIVIDYPEGRKPLVEQLLTSLRDYAAEDNLRIRLLLLSRQDISEWQPVIDRAGANSLFLANPLHLDRSPDPAAQFTAMLGGFAKVLGKPAPALAAGEPERWLTRNSAYHQPLFLAAAALNFCLHPEQGLALGGPDAVKALVRRERLRAEKENTALGWPPDVLPRLLALATLRGGLDSAKLNKLGQKLGVPAGSDICDRLRHGCDGRIRDNVLAPLEPDLPGAAFATQVLSERADMAPDWIWHTIADNPMGLIPRLEQVCHDAEGTLQLLSDNRISRLLVAMVRGEADRAQALRGLAFSDDRSHRFAPLAAAVGQVLLDDAGLDDADRAELLHSHAVNLDASGDRLGARDVSAKAVAIFEKLAAKRTTRFYPALACSLRNLSNYLFETGDGQGAQAAAAKSVAIRQWLAAENPNKFLPDLANSLDVLSNRLAEAGDELGALDSVAKSLAIRLWRAAKNPSQFPTELVNSGVMALSFVDKAVESYEMLAAENSNQFNLRLALNLNNLSIRLAMIGDEPRALFFSSKSVAILERLATEKPSLFNPDLAIGLNTLSNRLGKAGDRSGALDAITKAVAIRQKLAAENPGRFNPDLAKSLYNLSLRLAEADDILRALDAGTKSVAIRRKLAANDPGHFNQDLARSLANLAWRTDENGDRPEAIRLLEEAITLITPQANADPSSKTWRWLLGMQRDLARWRDAVPSGD